jgi:hypothetical protein
MFQQSWKGVLIHQKLIAFVCFVTCDETPLFWWFDGSSSSPLNQLARHGISVQVPFSTCSLQTEDITFWNGNKAGLINIA